MGLFGDGERGEAEAERQAEIEHMHVPMKKWYAESNLEYKQTWGEFPQFWKDACSWEHYREVKRAYIANQEGYEYKPLDAVNQEVVANVESGSSIDFENNNNNPVDTAQVTGSEEKKQKTYDEIRDERRSLWGNKRKSRFAKDALALSNKNKSSVDASKFKSAGVLDIIKKRHEQSELTPEQEQELILDMMKVDALCLKLKTVVQDAMMEGLNPNRPPSPAPIYDAMGSRVNTREVRMRDQLLFERDTLIKGILKLKPQYVTPLDYVREKPKRKLYIPIKEYPNYNFIGLVIGPRGVTQKAMEKESGSKIVIRGRGSSKEGANKRCNGGQDDEDQLHVLITADTEKQVEHAVKLVMPLLQPMDDNSNIHKLAQLQQLAKFNGTEKDELAAHARFNEQMGSTYMSNVKCGICGEPHATRDCPLAPSKTVATDATAPGVPPPPPVNMDEEYANLMSELTGTPKPVAAAPPPVPTQAVQSKGINPITFMPPVKPQVLMGVQPPRPPAGLPPPPPKSNTPSYPQSQVPMTYPYAAQPVQGYPNPYQYAQAYQQPYGQPQYGAQPGYYQQPHGYPAQPAHIPPPPPPPASTNQNPPPPPPPPNP